MKKVVLIALVLALVSTLATTPVLAESKSKGACKVDLFAPDGNVCGWVIAEVSSNGVMNLQIHVSAGRDAGGETGNITIVHDHHPPPDMLIGEMTLNMQGNGNAHFQREIPETAPEVLHFRVEVGPCLSDELAVTNK